MSALAGTVATFQARDVVRSRWLAAYVAFFGLVTEGLLRFAGGDARAILSLTSIVLYLVPLVTLVFGTVYLYNVAGRVRSTAGLTLMKILRARDWTAVQT